jgi:serine beta-lactamase-like protein LACTB, mitochondrial
MPFTRRHLLLGTAALATATHARTSNDQRVEALREISRGLMAAHPLPALSIAMTQGDQLVFAEAFGQVDLELGVSATPKHRFRLGSVSKVFTATAAAQLAARGVLDLDAPISNYLPDLPEQHRATTLRQLLTHRGGIRHYTDKDESREAPGPIDLRVYQNNADILALFINDPLIAKPGELVSYSTFGYTLASLVMEGAAKTPFLDILLNELAVPLRLESLGGDDPVRLVPDRVRGYHHAAIIKKAVPAFEGKWASIRSNNVSYKWAGGGLLATATDLARFGAAHLEPGKLSKQALTTLFTVQTERTERSPPLGLGWRIDEDAKMRLRWHHAGGQDGARASLVVYPREKLAIALATNVTGMPGDVNGASANLADAWVRE